MKDGKLNILLVKNYGIKPTAEGFIHLYNQIASSNSAKNNEKCGELCRKYCS